MKRTVLFILTALLSAGAHSEVITNSGIYGKLGCDVEAECHYVYAGGIAFPGVTVNAEATDGSFAASAVTDADGVYKIPLPAGTYDLTVDAATLPQGAAILYPSTGYYVVDVGAYDKERRDFVIDDLSCGDSGACWMTAGGVKFEPIMGGDAAQSGPKDSFGGNVNPSCSSEPGDGGQWNHISHSEKLHFLGTSIRVVRCGNVTDIDPGSESPATPFNFIEFEGEGTLSGIKGNKFPTTNVSFFGRVEDRNEPGNESSTEGEDVDRYYLHVFEGNGITHLLVDEDGDPDTVDPLTITGGNLQLHFSSCE